MKNDELKEIIDHFNTMLKLLLDGWVHVSGSPEQKQAIMKSNRESREGEENSWALFSFKTQAILFIKKNRVFFSNLKRTPANLDEVFHLSIKDDKSVMVQETRSPICLLNYAIELLLSIFSNNGFTMSDVIKAGFRVLDMSLDSKRRTDL